MDFSERNSHDSQRNRLLELLKQYEPDWVPIREVLDVAGFQYGDRIFELRRLGHRIENDPGRAFRLVSKAAVTPETQAQPVQPSPDLLFPLPPHEWRDDG